MLSCLCSPMSLGMLLQGFSASVGASEIEAEPEKGWWLSLCVPLNSKGCKGLMQISFNGGEG